MLGIPWAFVIPLTIEASKSYINYAEEKISLLLCLFVGDKDARLTSDLYYIIGKKKHGWKGKNNQQES